MASPIVERTPKHAPDAATISIPQLDLDQVDLAAPVIDAPAVETPAQPPATVPQHTPLAGRLLARLRHPLRSSAIRAMSRPARRRGWKTARPATADWAYLTEIAPRLRSDAWMRLVIGGGRSDSFRSL